MWGGGGFCFFSLWQYEKRNENREFGRQESSDVRRVRTSGEFERQESSDVRKCVDGEWKFKVLVSSCCTSLASACSFIYNHMDATLPLVRYFNTNRVLRGDDQ
ncbi:hypothetical protein BaRGS_00032030 [Batillaria attramentaria]|uniref:Uncharacterized protein n=1 Tax=Batillaria attramentaria TaxID=370345 RepID=A0ABD0JPF7_9CAEN